MRKVIEQILSIIASLATILQVSISFYFEPKEDKISQLLPMLKEPGGILEGEDNIIRSLLFLILELSLGWVFGFILVLLYLYLKTQARFLILFIPSILSAWVSYFNVVVILGVKFAESWVLFLSAYFMSYIIAVLFVSDHAKKHNEFDSGEIQLSLAVIQLVSFIMVFSINLDVGTQMLFSQSLGDK